MQLTTKTKILILASTFPTFAENDNTPPFVYNLSKKIAELGQCQLFILTPARQGGSCYEEKDGLKIYRFKYGFSALCDGAILPNLKKNKLLWLQVPFFCLFYFINLVKIIKREKINLIHAHWIIPQGLIAVIYKKFYNKDIKIIGTIHGGDIFGLQSILAKYLKKNVLNNLDFLTVVGQAIKNEVSKFKLKKNLPIEIVPMGVDDKKFNPKQYSLEIKEQLKINGQFLLFVGRLVEKKGVQYLLSAMPLIIKQRPEVKLIIIGGGPLEKKLKRQAGDLKIADKIIFLGPINNDLLPPYFATADIFIGPNVIAKDGDNEGFGLVLAEALLCGVPVVASDLPTISDIIINEKTGLQVDVKNVEKFSNTVLRTIEDKELRKRLVKNGYKHVLDKFSLNMVANKYNKLLLELRQHES